MTETAYDVIVIGGGPGGYVAAIKAAQLGMKVACIDKRSSLGGTCLNIGCIPSKALLQSSYKYYEVKEKMATHGIFCSSIQLDLDRMMQHKEDVVKGLIQGIQFLFKKNGVTFLQGTASFQSLQQLLLRDAQGAITHLTARSFIIATGSGPSPVLGITLDHQRIVDSTGALNFSEIPSHLVVIGGGYIGLEMASVWRRLGSEVTIVEFMDRIVPAMDHELGSALHKSLVQQGMKIMLGTKVVNVTNNHDPALSLLLESRETGQQIRLQASHVLSSAGRRPYTENLGLEKIGLKTDNRGMIPVNESFQTTLPHIYAIGDVIRGPMLAHKAEEEGVAVAEILAGQKPHVNYHAIPAVIYTHPEVASVGQTEEQLKEAGIPYTIGKFPFSANSRARAVLDTEGFVKILAHKESDEVLGVHIIHSEAGTMIAEAVLAMEYSASSEDIARTCHAHPTVSEAMKEAALAAHFKAIHI